MSRLLGWTKTERYDEFELNADDFSNQKTQQYDRFESIKSQENVLAVAFPNKPMFKRSRSIISSPRTIERFSLAKIRERLANPPLDRMAPARDHESSWEQQSYW